MKIFFTVSRSGKKDFGKDYDAILKELRRHRVSVVATYDKSYLADDPKLQAINGLSVSENDYRFEHDMAMRRAIFQCDAVIIEASHPSFRLGFEAFFALSQQKPVLVLSKFQNYGHLIDQPHFFGARYSAFTLQDELDEFVKHVKKYKLRNRFNLFISDTQKDHLEQAAKHYGVSMSDYLRKLIDNDTTIKKA